MPASLKPTPLPSSDDTDRWGRRLRFVASAGFSYVLVIAVTAALHELGGASTRVAYAGALVVALIYNFLANRHFVFRSARGDAKAQASRFVITSMGFRLGEWLAFSVLSATVTAHYTILATAVQVISLLLKYAVFRRFIFR